MFSFPKLQTSGFIFCEESKIGSRLIAKMRETYEKIVLYLKPKLAKFGKF